VPCSTRRAGHGPDPRPARMCARAAVVPRRRMGVGSGGLLAASEQRALAEALARCLVQVGGMAWRHACMRACVNARVHVRMRACAAGGRWRWWAAVGAGSSGRPRGVEGGGWGGRLGGWRGGWSGVVEPTTLVMAPHLSACSLHTHGRSVGARCCAQGRGGSAGRDALPEPLQALLAQVGAWRGWGWGVPASWLVAFKGFWGSIEAGCLLG
jgi:hypothetical protein